MRNIVTSRLVYDIFRIVMFFAAAVWDGFCQPVGAADVDMQVTAAEVIAGYRQNALSFRTLRVTGARHTQRGENLVNRVRLGGTTAEETLQALAEPKMFPVQIWTDRTGFQLRFPRGDRVEWTDPFLFPDAPLTEATFKTTFADYVIFTSQKDTNDGISMWGGLQGTRPIGATHYNPKDGYEQCSLPPLALTSAASGFTCHSIDQFFLEPTDKMEIVGAEMFDSIDCVVLERTERDDEIGEAWSSESVEIEMFWRYRAWIDPQRGFLPLRIEKSYYFVHGGKTYVDPWGLDPQTIATLSDIRVVPGGGFYPMETRLEQRAADVRTTTPFVPAERIVKGEKQTPLETVIDREDRWVISDVVADLEMHGLFEKPFPTSTLFYDHRSGRAVGMTQGDSEIALRNALNNSRRPGSTLTSHPIRWMLWLNLGLILGIACVSIYRWKKKQQGDSEPE